MKLFQPSLESSKPLWGITIISSCDTLCTGFTLSQKSHKVTGVLVPWQTIGTSEPLCHCLVVVDQHTGRDNVQAMLLSKASDGESHSVLQ